MHPRCLEAGLTLTAHSLRDGAQHNGKYHKKDIIEPALVF